MQRPDIKFYMIEWRFQMKVRIQIITILLLLSVVMLTGCNSNKGKLVNKFVIDNYNMSFTFPKEWSKITSETPYDLQCTDGYSYASIFTYYDDVVSEGETTMDIYYMQMDDIFKETENIESIADEVVTELEDKTIHSQMFTADKDGVANYYYFNLVESKQDKNVFAWVMFTALPDYAKVNQNLWDKIVASADWVE